MNPENIFVAKNRDSESAKRICAVISAVTMRTVGSIVHDTRVQKNTCCIEFFAIASLADIGDAGTPRDRANMSCSVLASRSPSARALRRQHFFKRDAVFFVVLVYSG